MARTHDVVPVEPVNEEGVTHRARRGGTTVLEELLKVGGGRAPKSFDEILATIKAQGELATAADIDPTGFTLWKGKAGKRRLVGVEFVIVDWQFNPGDYGKEYVSIRLVTKHGERVVINDSSTPGICGFMQDVRSTGYVGAIHVPGGINASKYKRKDENGDPIYEPGSDTPAMGESFWLEFNAAE